jgi:AcrR family transcriptional regulator
MTERSDIETAPTAPRVSDQRRPGRPRDARADAAIMDAAVAVLADRGPAGFTVDEVASRAGCGKATVYRRWPSRAELLVETARRLGLEPPIVDNGSLRADLEEMLSTLAHKMRDTPAGRILPGIIAEASVEPGMRRILAKFIADRRDRPREVMERGIARGELPADADVELILDLLGGTIMYRELIAREVVDRAYLDRLVDKVLGAFGATTVTPPG